MASIDILVADLGIASAGNSVTANRYRLIFERLGYRTTVTNTPTADIVVALNAYRTSAQVAQLHVDTKVVAVLTGTDLYRFWDTDRETVASTLGRATAIVGLNDQVGERLPEDLRTKLSVIKEGAALQSVAHTPCATPRLRAIVVGHLRDEKDPQLLLDALNQLPVDCAVQVDHYGAAHDDEWANWAREHSTASARYQWHGEVSRAELDANVYATADLLINTSRMEGGANVISEAVMCGLPIVATAIDGNVGVLGLDHPGLVVPGDADALAHRLTEIDTATLQRLAQASYDLQSELSVEHETAQWRHVLDRLEP